MGVVVDRYAAIVDRLTMEFVAKQRPADMFGAVFFDLREKAKDLKEKWSQEAAVRLEKAVRADLEKKGVRVVSFDISLGKYRGSRFVTSAKLRAAVEDEKKAEELAVYLRGKFSPKFKLKSFDEDSGEAFYNVR